MGYEATGDVEKPEFADHFLIPDLWFRHLMGAPYFPFSFLHLLPALLLQMLQR